MLTIRLNGHHEWLRVVVAHRLRGVTAATCPLLIGSLWQFHLHISMWHAALLPQLPTRLPLKRRADAERQPIVRFVGECAHSSLVSWLAGWLGV